MNENIPQELAMKDLELRLSEKYATKQDVIDVRLVLAQVQQAQNTMTTTQATQAGEIKQIWTGVLDIQTTLKRIFWTLITPVILAVGYGAYVLIAEKGF